MIMCTLDCEEGYDSMWRELFICDTFYTLLLFKWEKENHLSYLGFKVGHK